MASNSKLKLKIRKVILLGTLLTFHNIQMEVLQFKLKNKPNKNSMIYKQV